MPKKKTKDTRDIGLDVNPPKRVCNDPRCPWHGTLPVRGKTFKGVVVRHKAANTAVVEWEYLISMPKYERVARKRTRISVHVPGCMPVEPGTKVRIAECRPLSKTKHFVIVGVIK
jgi:small subunit ribosomal protein S17